MEEIKPGDKVQLKSGGPEMVVEDYAVVVLGDSDRSHAVCSWFNNSTPTKNTFPIIALKKVK